MQRNAYNTFYLISKAKTIINPSKHCDDGSTLLETTLCASTLEFTVLNNVETLLCISTLNRTTLDNVETTLSFSTLILTTLGNVETTLRIGPFEKKH